jgi:undecaprenyl diphosphate synthase
MLPVPRQKMPRHIAVIMDGNGRWAQRQHLPRIEGHRRGVASVRRTTEEGARLGLEQLTLYCLSSENWKRPQPELDFLMHLLEQYMIEERNTIMDNDIRVSVIGRRDDIPVATLEEMDKTVRLTAGNGGMRLCLAINYGARTELLDAVRGIAADAEAGRLQSSEITEQTIRSHLYTAGMPDPDLMIRTVMRRFG